MCEVICELTHKLSIGNAGPEASERKTSKLRLNGCHIMKREVRLFLNVSSKGFLFTSVIASESSFILSLL
jgi:hypothetical protein